MADPFNGAHSPEEIGATDQLFESYVDGTLPDSVMDPTSDWLLTDQDDMNGIDSTLMTNSETLCHAQSLDNVDSTISFGKVRRGATCAAEPHEIGTNGLGDEEARDSARSLPFPFSESVKLCPAKYFLTSNIPVCRALLPGQSRPVAGSAALDLFDVTFRTFIVPWLHRL